MGEKIKECWNCRAYEPYYIKGDCKFEKQKCGYCRTKERIVENKHRTCDSWHNCSTIKNMLQISAIKKIDVTLDCLLQIKQILIEDKEELEKPEIRVIELRSENRKYKKHLSDKR